MPLLQPDIEFADQYQLIMHMFPCIKGIKRVRDGVSHSPVFHHQGHDVSIMLNFVQFQLKDPGKKPTSRCFYSYWPWRERHWYSPWNPKSLYHKWHFWR